jgi:DMSO/TMAO reductase YedYZ molybdopterin-dependent catalytic subunit
VIRVSFIAVLCAGLCVGQTLTVSGDVRTPVTLTVEDLAKLPHETVTIPDLDGTKVAYDGVPLREILKRAGAQMEKELRGKVLSTYVLAKAKDGYAVTFTLGELAPEFGNATILVADKRDGKPLFGYQGPLRLVCPNDKAGARSVRMLETLEVVQLVK